MSDHSVVFNPYKYAKHLSPYGRNVLDELIKKWNLVSESDRSIIESNRCHHNTDKRPTSNICSRNKLTPSRIYLYTSENQQNIQSVRFESHKSNDHNTEKPLNLNIDDDNSIFTVVPTYNDLINDCTINSIYPMPKTDNYNDKFIPRFDTDQPDATASVEQNIQQHKSHFDKVNWDNMFDTDIFQDMSSFIKEPQDIKTNTEILSSNDCLRLQTVDPYVSLDTSNDTICKKSTRLTGDRLIENSIKEIKKTPAICNMPLPSSRKQRYTKTVKNWLCDAECNYSEKKVQNKLMKTDNEIQLSANKNHIRFLNKTKQELININDFQEKHTFKKRKIKDVLDSVNRESGGDPRVLDNLKHQKCANVNTSFNTIICPSITNSVSQRNVMDKKKVIQAELVKKDGKMKFKKPITRENDKSVEENIETVLRSKKETDIEKKLNHSEFTPPVKSGIPLNDITYDIKEINLAADLALVKELTQTNISDLYATLYYKNGYCQLNREYTQNECVPEGVLLLINEVFYYIKGSNNLNITNILEIFLVKREICCYEGKELFIYIKSLYNILLVSPQLSFNDVKIGCSLLNPEDPIEYFNEALKLISYIPMYTIATKCPLQKAAWYLTLLRDCFSELKILLMDNNLWNVYKHIEMSILPVIAEMENRGVRVDIRRLEEMENLLIKELKSAELECYKVAGKRFQINSTVQVRKILYDELQLDTKIKNIHSKEGKGVNSTCESRLRSLMPAHPLPKLILEYRRLHKAHATFVTGIAQHVKNGVVKPVWMQMAAVTGRISANNPNLQAIPKVPFNLVMFTSKGDGKMQQLNFREVYIAREGHTFLAADFKHIECRIFACLAADTGLLDALKSPDLFRVLAAKWLNKPPSDVSSEDRERTKRIVYASLYGAGPRRITEILELEYHQHQTPSVVSNFNSTFPSLKNFGRSVIERCGKNGGRLSTVCGRTRRFTNITSVDFALRSQAERQAINFIIQGSAADLCKRAMALTETRLRTSRPPIEGWLVLQIHDELVWEVVDRDLQRAAVTIKEAMESCGRDCGISTPLPVFITTGKIWGEMNEFLI